MYNKQMHLFVDPAHEETRVMAQIIHPQIAH